MFALIYKLRQAISYRATLGEIFSVQRLNLSRFSADGKV